MLQSVVHEHIVFAKDKNLVSSNSNSIAILLTC